MMTVPGAITGYFDLPYYERMRGIVSSWRELEQIEPGMWPDRETSDFCKSLILYEARLIDQRRFEEWLDLFSDRAAYWVPADVNGDDPARNVTWELNDRRRLEERVERIATGKAYSQLPPTRTVHSYSNIEMIKSSEDEVHVLCNFIISTSRLDDHKTLSGWNGYIIKNVLGEWKIELKLVSLFDSDKPQGNISFFL